MGQRNMKQQNGTRDLLPKCQKRKILGVQPRGALALMEHRLWCEGSLTPLGWWQKDWVTLSETGTQPARNFELVGLFTCEKYVKLTDVWYPSHPFLNSVWTHVHCKKCTEQRNPPKNKQPQTLQAPLSRFVPLCRQNVIKWHLISRVLCCQQHF